MGDVKIVRNREELFEFFKETFPMFIDDVVSYTYHASGARKDLTITLKGSGYFLFTYRGINDWSLTRSKRK